MVQVERIDAESSLDGHTRDMVFDFAEFIAANNPKVQDASLLPYPKTELMAAYQTFHAYLSILKETSQVRFVAEGGDLFLNQVGAMWVILEDFKQIDPQDKQIVDDINLGRNKDELVEIRMIVKYTGTKGSIP